MSGDIEVLFERAAREMRPGFKRELRELLSDITPVDDVADRPVDVDRSVLTTAPAPGSSRWYRPLLLVAAIALAVVAGLILVRPMDANEIPSAPPDSSCAFDAAELGVVQTQTIAVRVALMPDGHSFCLVDDDDAAALGSDAQQDLVVNDSTVGTAPPTEPTVVGQGVVSGTAYWYVVAIPDGMPVAYAERAGDRLPSFPTRVGRRLLVIDTDFDLRQTGDLEREVNLYSSAGVVLSTIVVPISTESGSVTDPNGVNQGEGPP